MEMVSNYLMPLVEGFLGWPPPSPYALLTLPIALFGLYMNVRAFLRLRREAPLRQQFALEELRARILHRVTSKRLADNLMSPQSLRALAQAVERKYSSPVITDLLIAEAIRRVALDIETSLPPSQLIHRLNILNACLRDLTSEENDEKLLSISRTDRLFSIIQSYGTIIILMCVSIIAIIYLESIAPSNEIYFITILVIAIIYINSLSLYRAAEFFREKGRLTIDKLNPILDFILLSALMRRPSSDFILDTILGPIWETRFMFLTPESFLKMHKCRYWLAEPMIEELRKLETSLKHKHHDDENLHAEFVSRDKIRNDLWVITGDESYR